MQKVDWKAKKIEALKYARSKIHGHPLTEERIEITDQLTKMIKDIEEDME